MSIDMNYRRLLGVLLLGSTALASSTALAQAASEQGAAVQETGLADIVVTARKRAETTQDVPVSISAFDAKTLAAKDLTNLEKLATQSPQFTVGRAAIGSGAQLTIRGIGSSFSSIGLEQSVAVVVDGVYYGQGRVINEGFFDLSRVELLKGPQALFFGKNATAGVVSITTAEPTANREIAGKLGYEFRSRNLIGELIASGPLTDTLSGRVAIRGTQMFGGYFKNRSVDQPYSTTDVATGVVTQHVAPAVDRNAPQEKEFVGRVTLKWEPTDALTATLKSSVTRTSNNNGSWNFVTFRCLNGTAQFNASQPCRRAFDIYQNAFPDEFAGKVPFLNDDGDVGSQYRSFSVTGSVNYELDDITFTNIANFNNNRSSYQIDGKWYSSPAIESWGTERTTFRAFSDEFRMLTSFDGPLNVMLGAYYQKTRREYGSSGIRLGHENSAAPAQYRYATIVKDSATDGETIAGFGQAIMKLIPKVELTAGVRYTHEAKDSYFIQPYAHPGPVAAGSVLPNVRVTADQTFTNWSPEATATYKPNRDITLYVAYKTAYKSGGFSNSGILSRASTVRDFTFEPEKAKGFEGGIKTTLLDRQLRWNLGIYRYNFTNLQVDFYNAAIIAFTTYNAGAARTQGVESDFEFAPRALPGLTLRGSLNYNKARYKNFPGAPCYTGQTIGGGCTIAAGIPRQDLSGTPTAMAPRWTGTFGANYDIPVGGGMELSLSADGRYSASYLTNVFGNPFSRQRDYVTLDAGVRLHSEDDRWGIALIGKNLTNSFYVTGSTDATLTGGGTGTAAGRPGDQVGLAALPRTVTLQLSVKY